MPPDHDFVVELGKIKEKDDRDGLAGTVAPCNKDILVDAWPNQKFKYLRCCQIVGIEDKVIFKLIVLGS